MGVDVGSHDAGSANSSRERSHDRARPCISATRATWRTPAHAVCDTALMGALLNQEW